MSKLWKVTLMILVTITLVAAVALVIIFKFTGDKQQTAPTADEILESSVDVPEITTNLADGSFIKISFKIQMNNEDAKAEAEKRDFQMKDIIIEQLSQMKPADFNGEQGKTHLKARLKEKINQIMQDGKVEQVYITSFILQ
ncbi:flagellar basal body-associated FliL family protein [Anoxybacillus sp. B7M1]|jgi:flagellar protein FliL|uniref:Flagellar protein FliL n=1 Tax=Anoxybacteroides rupiense TaxID=311460 RepID=A0ABD5IRR1_9BACL|nr:MULTISPECIES: flagellar basal body-associated protein FliL [Anoxybacillus]ANB56749.1 flagellar basal body-associated FliL family protein [Anoxybacillus sp. B2M1]ANB62563.1 flagellar basal body-associated FliL family protein [Anoxybacillus sp. B7M1]KXG10556.1 Flagellar FliL protein [Anoxybacillus sp. P3H1B]MBB3906160.1 flagellar FliL protein [Anoxybacillus rupiensis]MDE8563125.1 flagellar basal body-associated protein FliL [Anoxybacillus rupiensis]